MINDIIRRLEEYVEILKGIRESETEIVEGLSKQGSSDLYFKNLSTIYTTVEKMEKRMLILRQLKRFIGKSK